MREEPNRYYFIYTLSDPRTGRVRYVGFTVNPSARYARHLSPVNYSHSSNWIRSLRRFGLKPIMEIVECGTGDWRTAEQAWIAGFRQCGSPLTNETGGGEGMIGYKFKPESLAKMSLARIGNTNSKGKKMPEHVKEMLRKLSTNRKASEETKRKQSNALRGLRRSAQTRRNISLGLTGRVFSTDTLIKMSVSAKKRANSDEGRRALIRAASKRKFDRAYRKKLSEAQKRRHAALRKINDHNL